eukprot:gene2744-4254_t
MFVRYDELIAANEKAGKTGVVATLKREREFRDPGLLNFLRTMAEAQEKLLHELVFRDEYSFNQWMEL